MYQPMARFSRRTLLGVLAAGAALPFVGACGSKEAQAKSFPLNRSDAEWKKRLTSEEYRILRQAGTERAYTSPLNEEKRTGTYVCAGCAHPLFASKTKFESGTGWPSFYAPLKGGIGTKKDYKLGYPRTEVHCANCGGHLGHVFNDGPRPTGKRYCMNGAALDFVPA